MIIDLEDKDKNGEININDFLIMSNDEIKSYNDHKNFSVLIMNPPYDKSLHLKFLEKVIDIADNVITIQPSTFLINQKQDGKGKIYNDLKKKIDGHVSSVDINNRNEQMNVGLYVPLTIIHINMNKEYKDIQFDMCGESKKVKSIFDCNRIGEHNLLESILNKVINDTKFDKAYDHLYKRGTEINDDTWFCKISDILTGNPLFGMAENSSFIYKDYIRMFYMPCYYMSKTEQHSLYDHIPEKNDVGGKPVKGSQASCLYGTKEEMENWEHFVLVNKLPLFINICFTIDQHNNSLKYVPFIVDKQYTDEEILNMFDFTDKEIQLIEDTLEKFKASSEWFKNYSKGIK